MTLISFADIFEITLLRMAKEFDPVLTVEEMAGSNDEGAKIIKNVLPFKAALAWHCSAHKKSCLLSQILMNFHYNP